MPKYHIGQLFDPTTAQPHDSHTLQTQLIPENSSVLELGCASGYISGYLEQSRGCQVTGLDFDPVAVEFARTRIRHAYLVDLDSVHPLASAQQNAPYDVLYAANVLEHIRQTETVLRQAHTLLKPDGLAVIVLPNIAHWSVRLRLLRGQFRYSDYGIMDRTHVHFYTLETARELLASTGYRPEILHIAGSLIQNSIGCQHPLILPGLFAYEMIFAARKVSLPPDA